jgi:hypothetical protein
LNQCRVTPSLAASFGTEEPTLELLLAIRRRSFVVDGHQRCSIAELNDLAEGDTAAERTPLTPGGLPVARAFSPFDHVFSPFFDRMM